jgi:hypothetical protein
MGCDDLVVLAMVKNQALDILFISGVMMPFKPH